MDINIHLNGADEHMLIELNKADGLRYTNEEFAQRLFSSVLWVEYNRYYKNKEKIKEHD